MGDSNLPIGVFDSGLGGLTVVAELQRKLPGEDIIYLGDSARVPYGTRSAETVKRYAWNCSRFLTNKGLKMLVVACNTASAVAIDSLREGLDIPVLGVIRAGARSALQNHSCAAIGVIGTAGTIGSGAYPREIKNINPAVRVLQNPAPLLVPLVEEGWLEGDVPRLAIRRYLTPLVEQGADVVLLGCTHYPVLRTAIEAELKAMGSDARVVDSASAMALQVEGELVRSQLVKRSNGPGTLQCYVTDLPESFSESAGRFLGHNIGNVEKVDIS